MYLLRQLNFACGRLDDSFPEDATNKNFNENYLVFSLKFSEAWLLFGVYFFFARKSGENSLLQASSRFIAQCLPLVLFTASVSHFV